MTDSALPLFQRTAILGLGLMGGSLGLALRACGAIASIIGFDPAEGVAEAAIQAGAIERSAPTATTCVAGADLVVLATPLLAMRALLAEIGPGLADGALVTDLGSTKAEVMAWAAAMLPPGAGYIGGHPMCGSERSGIAAANATLYRDAVWCLTPGPRADRTALDRMSALVRRVGARALVLDAARHDAAVARVSHLPLLAAAALVTASAAHTDWSLAAKLAAGGFRDTTRVASGSPAMARDICLTNAPAITAALDAYIDELQALRAEVSSSDGPGLLMRFAAARAARNTWLDMQPSP